MPDAHTLQSLALTNSYRLLQPWIGSTGLRTREVEHRTLGDGTGPRAAEEFLLASRLSRHDPRVTPSTRPYFTDEGQAAVSLVGAEAPADDTIALPPSCPLERPLGAAIAERRSTRAFSGQAIDCDELATILRAAAGVTGEGIVELESGALRLRFRAAPSGGGLYPVELHVAALRVRDLAAGVYRYDPLADVLVGTAADDAERLRCCCVSPVDAQHLGDASFVVMFVLRSWRSMRKYGSRGLRFALIEIGAMVQAVHLSAQALGLGTVDCGSFCDDEVHECLDLDGVFNCFAHATIGGERP